MSSMGLTLEKAAVQYKDDPSVGFVYPKDGTSAVPDGWPWLRDAPMRRTLSCLLISLHLKSARPSRAENWGRRPVRSDMEVGEGMAKLEDIPLVDYDFDWAANEKEAIIEHFNDIMVD